MGESGSTKRNRQNLFVIQMIGLRRFSVKLKNRRLRITFQGSDPQRVRAKFRFGNVVENFVNPVAGAWGLVSKVEKVGQLFALETECDEAAFSS